MNDIAIIESELFELFMYILLLIDIIDKVLKKKKTSSILT